MSDAEGGKLSKDEVDALLQATREEEAEPEPEPEPSRRVHGYDFKQPSRFNKAQLKKLRRINEALAQNATAHASRLLRSNVKTQLVSMDQMKWDSLLEEAGESVAGLVFMLEPLGYRGVLVVEGQFAAVVLERMMGGQVDGGQGATVELTDLDVRLLRSFLKGFLDPLPELWRNIGEFEVQHGDFVQDLQTLDLFPGGEDFVQFCFLMQSNVGSGQISVAVPFQAVRGLPPEAEETERAAAEGTDESMRQSLRKNLERVNVELTVLLGTADIKIARLVHLKPGDVILLDTRIGDALEVKVNDKVKFGGYPGVRGGKYAVKFTVQGR